MSAELGYSAPIAFARAHGAASSLLLARQFASPLVLILIAAAGISWLVGEQGDALIIVTIVVASGLVGWWQERSGRRRGARAARPRRAARQRRPRRPDQSLAVDELVPGDVLRLAAGSIVPADLRLLESTNLYVDQAALTGETFPVEKSPASAPAAAPIVGSFVGPLLGQSRSERGGLAVVVETGRRTELGQLAAHLVERRPPSAFERGLERFGLMLVRVTAVLLALVFAATVYLDHPVLDGLLFSLALAVGITPELLPAIVSVTWHAVRRHGEATASSSSAWRRSRTSAAWTCCAPTRPAR